MGRGKEKKPISWVSWEVLFKPKEEGGLGFRDIRKFNYALKRKGGGRSCWYQSMGWIWTVRNHQ